MSTINYPKILSKAPCNDDLFKDGSHMKLASVIADEIRNDQNCTIIGIDGGWGSGKSNLVGLIRKKLHGDEVGAEKYHFFTYDAWAHQNDAHRRTILEDLITNLIDEKSPILDSQSWNLSLQHLLAKSKTTNKKVVPSLGPGVIISGLLIVLTPILNWAVNYIPVEWLRPIVFLLLYFLVYFLCFKKHARRMKEKYKQKYTWEIAVTEFLLIYKDNIKEDVTYEVISEREPSSREFRRWIHQVNQELKDNKGKVLVLVFDNMDRMPKSKVQELWATILSFFSEEKYSNIRVIVPFDRNHIKSAFQSEDILQGTDHEKEIAASYGNDFINKTFYVVYHVAPPILSGWKHYFQQQWEVAFGPTLPLDDKVLQVYDLLTKEQTPRKIIAFINEFVTIKQYADSTIPLEYIALFIFGKEKIALNPMTEIIKPSYLGTLDFLYGHDEKMMGYISSLYYQMDYESAIDVVFVDKFRRELDSNTPDTIRLMKENGSEKFWGILNNSIVHVQNVENASYLLDSIFGKDEDNKVHHLWECLYKLFRNNNVGITIYQDFHKLLLEHVEEAIEFRDKLLDGYLSHVDSGDFDIEHYCYGIDSIAEVGELDTYEVLQERGALCSPKLFIELVEKKKDNWNRYGLIVEEDDLDRYLVSLKDSELQKLNAITYIKDDLELPKYRQYIKEKIKSEASNEEVVKLYLSRLSDFKEYPIKIDEYLDDSQINNLFASSKDERFRSELIAMRLSRLSDWFVQKADHLNKYIGSTSIELVFIVSKFIVKYLSYGEILLNLSSFDSELLKAVAKEITINGEVKELGLSLLKVLSAFDKIIEKSDIKEEELLNRLDAFERKSITAENVINLPYKLFEAAYNHKELALTIHLREKVDDFLNLVEQEQWEKDLLSEKSMSYRLFILHSNKVYPNCSDALKTILKEYALGKLSVLKVDVVDEILGIVNRLKKSTSVYFTPLRTLYINEEAVMTVEKFKVLGRWLFEYASLETKEKSLQYVIPTEILSDKEALSIVCIYRNIVSVMVKNAPLPVAAEFKEKLKALSSINATNEEFILLCNDIDIEILLDQKENTDGE